LFWQDDVRSARIIRLRRHATPRQEGGKRMSTTYTVVPGDSLSRIAQRFGLRSWRQIYDDPANAGFRRRRPDPNLIMPGDVLVIPGGTAPGPAPPPASRIEAALEAWLVANRQGDPADHLATRTGLVLLGETHVGKARKAQLLARVVQLIALRNPARAAFHASEHYLNDPSTQVAIQNYVFSPRAPGARLRAHLPALVQPFEPVLDAARQVRGHRYAIIAAGSAAQEGDPRHAGIHLAFNASLARHNTLHSLNQLDRRSQGNVLIGGFHAARRHTLNGSTPTTCMRLVAEGWPVRVIRLTVNEAGGGGTDSSGAITIIPGEGIHLAELGSPAGSGFDLLPMLNRVAGGRPFFAEIRGAGSPFAQLRSADEADIPYTEHYDAIMHLP
jgi:hypothetical protein